MTDELETTALEQSSEITNEQVEEPVVEQAEPVAEQTDPKQRNQKAKLRLLRLINMLPSKPSRQRMKSLPE